MTESKISQVLARLLHNKGMRVIDLARATNVPQPTLHRLVSGTSARPHIHSLTPVASYFGITINQLMGNEPISWLADSKDEFAKKIGAQRVSLLNWEDPISWINNENPESYNQEKIITDSLVSEKAFALTINDSSMSPVFPPNTQVIFDPNKPYKDRSYVLAKLAQHELPIFRQLLVNANQSLLKPLSPDLERYNIQLLSNHDKILASLIEAKVKFTE